MTWSIIAIVAIVVIVIAAGLLIRRYPAVEEGMRLARLVLAGSVIAAAASAVGTITGIARALVDSSVFIDLPVNSYWPTLPPYVTITDGPTAEVTSGGFTSAHVMVSGLSTTVRAWLAAGQFVQGATVTVIALALALLCHRLIRDDPFRSTVAVATTVGAIALGIGGIMWQVCFSIAELTASHEVLGVTAWSTRNSPIDSSNLADFGWPPVGMGFQIDLWPIAGALALGALAVVFRRGARLQRETESLRRETDGLV